MNFNAETFRLMGKLCIGMVAILMIVFLIAYITPWLSKKIDNVKNKPARVNDKYNFQKDNLNDIYGIKKNDDKISSKEVNKDGKSE